MNELMHVMQKQNDSCDARIKWCIWCNNDFFLYTDGHSSHLPWLNHGCKIECLYNQKTDSIDRVSIKDQSNQPKAKL